MSKKIRVLKKTRKIRHDPELERMAKKISRLLFNKSGADKNYVLQAHFYFNDYFSRIKSENQ